jgi:hypothetical protein
MTSYEEIKQEIKLEIANGETLEEIRERSYELVDNYVPIYNNRIVEDWQSMPSDYDNRGSAELGHNCEELNIINLMMSDLYIYYTELVGLVIDDLAQELAGAE